MAKPTLNFRTPLCELRWVNISGEGKFKLDPEGKLDKNDRANYQYVATAIMTESQAEPVIKQLKEFWRNNKPAGATNQKYDIVKPSMVKVLDEKGEPVLDDEGAPLLEQEVNDKGEKLYSMLFKTSVVWPDGKPQVIKVLRANGNPLNLGDKKIGNGSIGVIHGTIGVNGFKGNEGLLAFLKAIQLKKFVEYTGDDIAAENLGEDTEGLDGLEDIPDAADISQEGPEV